MTRLMARFSVSYLPEGGWAIEVDIIGRDGVLNGIILKVVGGGEGELPEEVTNAFAGVNNLRGDARFASLAKGSQTRQSAEGQVQLENLDAVLALRAIPKMSVMVLMQGHSDTFFPL